MQKTLDNNEILFNEKKAQLNNLLEEQGYEDF